MPGFKVKLKRYLNTFLANTKFFSRPPGFYATKNLMI